MSDIAERLRALADLFEAGDAPRHLVLHMRAGADEIERKKAEIASLLNLLADARTESMRLRAALRPLTSGERCINDNGYCWTHGYSKPCPHAIARAALEGK